MTIRNTRLDTPCTRSEAVLRPVPGGTASPRQAVPQFMRRTEVTLPASIGYYRLSRTGQHNRHGWEG
jgi:hypothetical protein